MTFAHASGSLEGTIAKLNPKRALVDCGGGEEFHVPYAMLRHCSLDAGKSNSRRLEEVSREAERLMARHGLREWSFQFDDAAQRAGACDYRLKVLSLSRQFSLESSGEQARDTVLHEIAHALVGKEHNHDAVWKEKARAIGCTGDRCHRVRFAPPGWIASCPRCRWTQTRNRRLRGAICKKCCSTIAYRRYSPEEWEATRNGGRAAAVSESVGPTE